MGILHSPLGVCYFIGQNKIELGSREIGFYVHHHGRGHANRARQIIAYLDEPVTIFGSSVNFLRDLANERIRIVELPSDVVPEAERDPPPDMLHYAPLRVPGIRERMFRLAEWVYRTPPSLLVIDVSVEVALFARLLSVPTVVMRQNGHRDDLPHRAAYQSAQGLLAPYSADLEDLDTPDWIRQKTYYAGGFSRYTGRALSHTEARHQLKMDADQRYAVVMSGLGGAGNPLEAVRSAAQACPDWRWWMVGPTVVNESELPPNVKIVGQVDDTFPYLRGADVVVASAGNNTVMEVATAGASYICIPEERPFDEQRSKAEALDQVNAAMVLDAWPEAGEWAALLERAMQTDTSALVNLIDANGAKRCARYLHQVAEL